MNSSMYSCIPLVNWCAAAPAGLQKEYFLQERCRNPGLLSITPPLTGTPLQYIQICTCCILLLDHHHHLLTSAVHPPSDGPDSFVALRRAPFWDGLERETESSWDRQGGAARTLAWFVWRRCAPRAGRARNWIEAEAARLCRQEQGGMAIGAVCVSLCQVSFLLVSY